jgi:hypothetical protein
MDRLGRYPLSVILSFLEEVESCSLLITRRKWAFQLLPIFRLQDGLRVVGAKNRHRFVVVPVQDTLVRLERLNTKRMYKRRQVPNDKKTAQLAYEEWKQPRQFPPLLRFLRTEDSKQNVFLKGITLLVSYPRSGNTLMRSLLERTAGIVTGSDTRPDRTLSLTLADAHGLVGEGICANVVFCKTHWPERMGCQVYRGQRAVMLIRNPFDAIDSYWNLNVTNTHTAKVTDEIYERHQAFFYDLVRNEMKVWLNFHRFWSLQDIQILWIRYEDLICDPKRELEKIIEFSTNYDPTVWKERVHGAVSSGSYGYRSQESSPSFGRSLRRYSEELIQELHTLDKDGWLRRFGYNVFEQGFPNNMMGKSGAYLGMEQPTRASEDFRPLMINQPEMDLRPPLCPYGRNMRNWRRRYTKDDTEPFPTVARK